MKPPQSATGVKRAVKEWTGSRSSPQSCWEPAPPSPFKPTTLTDGGRVSGPWFFVAEKESATLVPLIMCLTFTAGQGPAPLEVGLTLQGFPIT